MNTWNREKLLEYLAELRIEFQEIIHKAVFTLVQSAMLGATLSGSRCKNLLVQDKKGNQRFLVVTGPDTGIDLGALGRALGTGRLSMCPAEAMRDILHVKPGALSPLALVADTGPEKVRLLMDRSLRNNQTFLFHPLANTSTISIRGDDLETFLLSTGHMAEYVDMPMRLPTVRSSA
ncbi:prolyl-tRNA synthetase associated domain-containing protein [Hydrogenophaga sp. OTU3427]|uniref:prolyl-tRNA synthetase associated domain-containing protein n=1 Tax=Hydrogenophaga sp. OTU3427 TaxID=3043856 RepID=UPI00313B57B5